MLRPYEKRVASTGGHPSRGDREFAPSDTQEFSLPLQKAGEFKGLLPVPPGPGDDGDAEGTGSKRRVTSRPAFGRVNEVEEQDVIVHGLLVRFPKS